MEKDIESIKIDPVTGKKLRRGVRVITIDYSGLKEKIAMPGWYAGRGDEGYHSKTDLKIYDRALNKLKAKHDNLLLPEQIRETRKLLKLTQVEAGELIGGGIRAFQKYESGDGLPSKAVSNLLVILAKKPELIKLIAK